jgi:hypothetical protein
VRRKTEVFRSCDRLVLAVVPVAAIPEGKRAAKWQVRLWKWIERTSWIAAILAVALMRSCDTTTASVEPTIVIMIQQCDSVAVPCVSSLESTEVRRCRK